MAMSFQCAAEQAAWREVKEGWRPLYGDVDSMGVAVEWHDFQMARSFNWGRTFHPRSLEFCLNLGGHGEVGATAKTDYAPGNSGYYAVGDEPLPASRRGGYTESSAELVPLVIAVLQKGDTVLVKGSLGSKMAVVIDALKAWGA